MKFDLKDERFRTEFRRLFSFGVIGLASLGLNVGIYGLQSRILWPSGNRTLEYAITVILVTWLNYEANRRFTFDARQRTIGAMGRFATVAVVALGLNSVIFWIGHDVFHILDFYVIIASAFMVAVFTFFSHRWFTFHRDPWRHFTKKA